MSGASTVCLCCVCVLAGMFKKEFEAEYEKTLRGIPYKLPQIEAELAVASRDCTAAKPEAELAVSTRDCTAAKPEAELAVSTRDRIAAKPDSSGCKLNQCSDTDTVIRATCSAGETSSESQRQASGDENQILKQLQPDQPAEQLSHQLPGRSAQQLSSQQLPDQLSSHVLDQPNVQLTEQLSNCATEQLVEQMPTQLPSEILIQLKVFSTSIIFFVSGLHSVSTLHDCVGLLYNVENRLTVCMSCNFVLHPGYYPGRGVAG